MLDDLLKKLKAALPEQVREKLFKNKADDDIDDDYEDDEDEEVTDVKENPLNDDDTDVGIDPSSEDGEEEDNDEDDDDEDDEELDEEEEKKKKKQKIIRIVAVGAIVFLALDFLLDEGGDSVDDVLDSAPPPAQIRRTEEPPVAQEPEPVEEPTPVVREEPPQIEREPEPAPVVVEETPYEPEPTFEFDEEEFVYEEEPEEVVEVIPPLVLGESRNNQERETEFLPIDDIQEAPVEEAPRGLLDQISQRLDGQLDYTEPPSFEYQGRGLVYNCVGRHWACVERESYFQCRDNQLWAEQEGKAAECGVRDVYASTEDCRIVQIHYINTNEPTDFCNEP